MNPEPEDINELVEALRADLPSERDAARIRARLAGFGVAVGAGLTSAEALASLAGAKAGASAASTGLVSQLGALSWGAKLGAAAAVSVSLVTVPIIVAGGSSEPAPAASTPSRPVALRKPAPASQLATAPVRAPELDASTGEPQAPAATATSPERRPEQARVLERAEVAVGARSSDAARVAAASPLREEPATSAPALGDEAATSAPALEPRAAGTAPVSVEPVTARGSTLAEETRLIDAAFSALQSRDPTTAEGFVREHERRFPDGLLRRERERARALLLERR